MDNSGFLDNLFDEEFNEFLMKEGLADPQFIYENGKEPVDVVEFIESPEFLNMKGIAYSKVKQTLWQVEHGNGGKGFKESFFELGKGSGKCFTLDSVLTTANGLVRACRISPNTKDIGFTNFKIDLINGNAEKETSIHHFYNGKKKVLVLKLNNGIELKVTPNHPLMTFIGWKEAKDLRAGDLLISWSGLSKFGKETIYTNPAHFVPDRVLSANKKSHSTYLYRLFKEVPVNFDYNHEGELVQVEMELLDYDVSDVAILLQNLGIDARVSGHTFIIREKNSLSSFYKIYSGQIPKDGKPHMISSQIIEILEGPEEPTIDFEMPITHSFILNGVISHNTVMEQIFLIYGLYRVLCLKNPQKYLNHIPGQPIVFLHASISEKQAKEVGFAGAKAMIEGSPWFRNKFTSTSVEIRFPKNVIFYCGHSGSSSWLGYGTLRGCLDEVNFMRNSANRSVSWDLYRALKGSLITRFPDHYKLMLVSSPLSENSMLHKIVQQVERDGEAFDIFDKT